MRDSPDFLPSASPAERWFFMDAGRIERRKAKLVKALAVMNMTVAIECRDRIRRICAKGESLLSPGPKMEKLSLEDAPLPDDLDEETHEGSILRSIRQVIVSARSWLEEHFPRDWLENDLPPKFLDGFRDAPGGSRTPVPASPLPGGLRATTARKEKISKPARSPIFVKRTYA